MTGKCTIALLSGLLLSACAGGTQMSTSSPTPGVSSGAVSSPNFSTPTPAMPRNSQGGGEGGNGGQGGPNGQGTAGSGGR